MDRRQGNPFVIGRYISDYYFCDREDETDFLIKQVKNGRDVALISPRRMGKTGLIQHFFNQPQIKDSYICIFIDIYATSSLADLVKLLGNEVYTKVVSTNRTWYERLREVVKSAIPRLSIDPLSGEPSIGLDFSVKEVEITLRQIFEYINEAPMPCIIAIDEFQQCEKYKGENVPALLRAYMQSCNNARFLFAGSEHSMMNNMFLSPAKPFYQSCVTVGIPPIQIDKYVDFAVKMFSDYGKSANREILCDVYRRYDGCTWFVHMMFNELFALVSENEHMNTSLIQQAEDNIIGRQEYGYNDIMARLSPRQRELMNALAKSNGIENPLSSEFVRKYGLQSASSVQSALKVLTDLGFATKINGKTRIYDYFFQTWLRKYGHS